VSVSSLGFNTAISVLLNLPNVLRVTSPDINRLYTIGDTLTLYVVFDIAVLLTEPGSLVLKLATGEGYGLEL
jgi:hypothetical protein